MSDLFDSLILARASDPSTSRQAAEFVVSSGTVGRMMELALEALRAHPGSTSKELELAAGGSDGSIRKRLADLKRARLAYTGQPRRCRVTGRNAQTWYPEKG